MSTFISSLPDDLFAKLGKKSKKLSIPKNKLIENALRLYLDHLEKAEYIQSYRRTSDDSDILPMVEEGMADYLKRLEK